mgnify:CR=1 FL=1
MDALVKINWTNISKKGINLINSSDIGQIVPEIDFTLSVDSPDRPHKELKINSSILKKF